MQWTGNRGIDPMLNIKRAQVETAGAYVSVGDLYPFVIGWKLHNGNIPVIRLNFLYPSCISLCLMKFLLHLLK